MHTGLDAGQCGSDSSLEHAIAFAIGVMCSVRTITGGDRVNTDVQKRSSVDTCMDRCMHGSMHAWIDRSMGAMCRAPPPFNLRRSSQTNALLQAAGCSSGLYKRAPAALGFINAHTALNHSPRFHLPQLELNVPTCLQTDALRWRRRRRRRVWWGACSGALAADMSQGRPSRSINTRGVVSCLRPPRKGSGGTGSLHSS